MWVKVPNKLVSLTNYLTENLIIFVYHKIDKNLFPARSRSHVKSFYQDQKLFGLFDTGSIDLDCKTIKKIKSI